MSATLSAHELATIDLGDRRLDRRAMLISDAIGKRPDASFPSTFDTEAGTEAFYRLVNNDSVTPDALLAPHHAESWRRAVKREDSVLVLHDTTEFKFRGEVHRDGLQRMGQGQGYHGHFALAVAEAEAPVVHGVVGSHSYVVENKAWLRPTGEGELYELLVGSERWGDLVEETRAASPVGLGLIHVMDREADDYALWTRILESGGDFVIRGKHNRRLEDAAGKLLDAVAEKDFVVSRTVSLSRRSKKRPPASKRTHPPRQRRPARLSIRAATIEVKRPNGLGALGEPSMTLNVVEVVEVDPPDDATAIHWVLLSTLPVDTADDICRIVDIYRKRWIIEEFFKALKTGCAAEKRQARSLDSLMNTMALLVPIAWRLLVLRARTRDNPTESYDLVVDAVELQALRQLAKGHKLPKRPTCRQVMLAIARVGGHLKSNGEPGWLVLGRGMERLLEYAAGWRAALKFAALGGELEM